MDIKKRKGTAKRIRVREESSSPPDSESDSGNVVRPDEPAIFKKRKRSGLETATPETPSEQTTGDSTKAQGIAASGSEIRDSKSETKVGPVKAASSIRMTTFTDFAPDVCKDYKKTGFCGFGDSCKFLHAREDYKQGWALDNDWEKTGKDGTRPSGTIISTAADKKHGLRNDAERVLDEEEEERRMLEKIPFACTICEKSYSYPIVTKCGHYFCEACALQRFRKSPNCAICGAGTGGVFNVAKKLKELLKKKKDREGDTSIVAGT